MTTTAANINSSSFRLDRTRPALSLLDELLAAWEIEWRACRFTSARALWVKVEQARRAS